MPRAIDGVVAPRGSQSRGTAAASVTGLQPSCLTAEPQVEVDHLRRKFVLFEITNGLAMVAKRRNRRRLQSLQVLARDVRSRKCSTRAISRSGSRK